MKATALPSRVLTRADLDVNVCKHAPTPPSPEHETCPAIRLNQQTWLRRLAVKLRMNLCRRPQLLGAVQDMNEPLESHTLVSVCLSSHASGQTLGGSTAQGRGCYWANATSRVATLSTGPLHGICPQGWPLSHRWLPRGGQGGDGQPGLPKELAGARSAGAYSGSPSSISVTYLKRACLKTVFLNMSNYDGTSHMFSQSFCSLFYIMEGSFKTDSLLGLWGQLIEQDVWRQVTRQHVSVINRRLKEIA